jgi:hypothetical protein
MCTLYVIDNMEFAVGRMYVMHHFNNHSKKAVSFSF